MAKVQGSSDYRILQDSRFPYPEVASEPAGVWV
jgi:hypothetical protein